MPSHSRRGDDADASADGDGSSSSATGSLLPPRSANTSSSNFAAAVPVPPPPASRDGSTSPVRRVGSRPTLSGFPRSASTGTFHPSYYRRTSSSQQLQNLPHIPHTHRHDESHPPHAMTRWGEDLVEGARLPRARGAGATLAESRSVVAALVARHDAEKAARVKKQTSDGGAEEEDDGQKGGNGGNGSGGGSGGGGSGDAKLDLNEDDPHLAVEDGPWYRQITLRSLVFGTLLGVLFAVITNKLNLTAGIIPSLGMAATLLGYFAMNGWSRLVRRCGFESAPFSQQENTMMQTFISACAGAAFSGGFGSYLIAMDRQSYENVGTGTPGNRPEDVFEPSLARTIPYMFCISFVGIFMLVQLRKRFIIDYDLPYPSGTAGKRERVFFFGVFSFFFFFDREREREKKIRRRQKKLTFPPPPSFHHTTPTPNRRRPHQLAPRPRRGGRGQRAGRRPGQVGRRLGLLVSLQVVFLVRRGPRVFWWIRPLSVLWARRARVEVEL